MSDGTGRIHEKIKSFQSKYYLNLFIKGAILTLAIVLGYLVIASVLEHNLWLSQWARLSIFITFFCRRRCLHHQILEPAPALVDCQARTK